MTRFLEWLGDNPTAWFLLLLAAFMGAGLTVGWACEPTWEDSPPNPCVLCETPPVETEVGP